MQNQNSNRYQDKNVSNKYVFVKIGTTDRSNLVVSTLEYAKRFISDKQVFIKYLYVSLWYYYFYFSIYFT